MVKVKTGKFTWTFNDKGLPCSIKSGKREFLKAPAELIIEDGEHRALEFSPAVPPVIRKSNLGGTLVEFDQLTAVTQKYTVLTLRHEIFKDGTIFTDAFFADRATQENTITRLELIYKLDFSDSAHTRWAFFHRPKRVDGALIQSMSPERGLEPCERIEKNGIFPFTSFNVRTADGPTFYLEMFMEGDCVLSHNPLDNESSVTWEDKNPVLRWNFQKTPAVHGCVPLQWRNRWGMVISPAPTRRNLPPPVMYHCQDNYIKYPSNDALQAIADNGVDVLAIHECWRLDAQNDGVPADEKRFREIVEFAHARGIRVCPYIRGNERSVIEHGTDWFRKYLKYDFDGLYMDYGGPFHFFIPADENFLGGRINFREHYINNLERRKVIGKNGVLLSHTGPYFSALGMTGGVVDGYVSGEGERGIMIKSRDDHAYYAMTAACGSTLWTAAFPEYMSPRIVPALAATGQSPHSAIGLASYSSSLAHPPTPGINDVNFRPLWKLWRLMKGEKNLQIFNDYNCAGVFPQKEELSHYMMISGGKAVCIFANFTDQPLTVIPQINWKKTSFIPKGKLVLCQPDTVTPGKAEKFTGKSFTLKPYGVAALCSGKIDYSEYEKPYPELTAEGKEYLAEIEKQRLLREPSEKADWFIRIESPKSETQNSYEESLIADLHNNRVMLGKFEDGKFVEITELKKESPWVRMKPLLGGGVHKLAVRTFHLPDNEPFYSFIKVQLSKDGKDVTRDIIYLNDLESDRSCINFMVDIEK